MKSSAITARGDINGSGAVVKSWPVRVERRLFENMDRLRNDPLNFQIENRERLGDYVKVKILPGFHMYVVSAPEAIEHVLFTHHKNYRKPDFFNKSVGLLAGNGILTNEGESWLRQRKLSQPAFLKPRIPSFGPCIVESTAELVEDWERVPAGTARDVVPDLMATSLRIAGRALFSTDLRGNTDELGRALRAAFPFVMDRMNGRPGFPLWFPSRANREFRFHLGVIDRVVNGMIADRRAKPTEAGDVLDMLLEARDEDTGEGMSDVQLRDEVVTLLIAGHETVGAALSWALHLLSNHPEIQENLRDECFGALGGRRPAAEDLPRLPLTTAVFEESLRLYPPAWGQPREAIDDDEINGYPVPRKAIFQVTQWLAHRHPDYWVEPNRFNPDRFLSTTPQDRPRGAYFPFGGGPRVCIGNAFAMLEGPLILAAIAQRFRFRPRPDHTVEIDSTFTLRPKNGVPLFIDPRG